MLSVKQNIDFIKNTLPQGVSLVAVSKYQSEQAIIEAYKCGQRIFGESKIQELKAKYEKLPKDIQWHMIGHLQRNKVKYIAPFISLIHSVDSIALLQEIQKQALKNKRIIRCLLQLRISEEPTKFGLEKHQIIHLLESEALAECTSVQICGLMAMASNTSDKQLIKSEFLSAQLTFKQIKEQFPQLPFEILSMGMTCDWPLAVEFNSNMVRIGSLIFGNRN